MGGNVFSEGTTRRFLVDEYFQITPIILNTLIGIHSVNRCEVISTYSEKESFGDADILYSTFDNIPIDARVFGAVFNTKNVSRNSEVTSIEYNQLQVDFIHIHQDHFDYGLHYFMFSDCGNLVGKLAHQLGMKHGHKGLVLPLRDGNNKFSEVTLTLDPELTLIFLGLDRDKFRAGFNNLQEIFEFISASPYYLPDAYKLENLNTIARIRDRKRDTYRKFLEYGATYVGPTHHKVDDKSIYLQKIFEFFPDAYPVYKDALQKLALQKLAKEKFNGNIVTAWTGLKDKELGEFMKELRRDWYFSNENILNLSVDQIRDRVLDKRSSWF